MFDFSYAAGKLFVLFGPSGSGKSSLKKLICDNFAPATLKPVVTCTTRAPRTGEQEGADYFFIMPEEFAGLDQADMFFETANFLNNSYATPLSELYFLNLGQNLIVTVELEGLKKLAKLPCSVLIFVTAESQELLRRVLARCPEANFEQAKERLALDALQCKEALEALSFKYKLINTDLKQTINELTKIITMELA